MERPRRPEAAEAAKQDRTGKEPERSGKRQGGKAMDHGSIGEEQGRSRGERGRKQQERERSWELRLGEQEKGRIRQGTPAAEATKQERTGKGPAGSEKGQGGKPARLAKDH